MTDRYVSPSGSGEFCTLGQPCSLATGLGQLVAGDRLILRDGTYTNSDGALFDDLGSGESFSNPITITNYADETATIEGTDGSQAVVLRKAQHHVIFDGNGSGDGSCGIRFTSPNGNNGLKITDDGVSDPAHHIRLQYVEIYDTYTSGILSTARDGAGPYYGGYNEFLHLKVHDCGTSTQFDHGFYLSSPNNLIEFCEVYGNAAYNIQIDDQGAVNYNNVVRNCRVYGPVNGAGFIISSGGGHKVYNNVLWGCGINIDDAQTEVQIFNNTIYNGAYSIFGYGPGTVTIKNNLIVNGSYGIYLEPGATGTWVGTNNTILNSSLAPIRNDSGGGDFSNNTTSGNADFVNADKQCFFIQSTSTARNNGVDLSTYMPAVDFDGTARPQQGAWDAGAYEFVKNAEGFGENVTGGAGGEIRYVTNLNDSGVGSFRYALAGDEASVQGPRIVKFQVSGTIALTDAIYLKNGETTTGQSSPNANYDDLTIDGSDAPDRGVQTAGDQVSIQCDNVIVKQMRFRSDEQGTTIIASLELNGATNVVIDHCSIEVGDDGDLDIVNGCDNLSVQYCIFGPNCGPGIMLFKYAGTGQMRGSIHHNLFFINSRNPECGGPAKLDFVNNVIYTNDDTWGIENRSGFAPDEGIIEANIVGNYYKYGQDAVNQSYPTPIYFYGDRTYSADSSFYVASNGLYDETNTLVNDVQSELYTHDAEVVGSRFDYPLVTTMSAAGAYADVMANAGARLPCGLDSMDQLILGHVNAGTGRSDSTYSSIADIGGYPDLTQPCGGDEGESEVPGRTGIFMLW